MEFYYLNSMNEKLDFTKEPYLMKDISELLDYDWDYETDNERIKKFKRTVCEIPFSINMLSDTEEEYNNICNNFYNVTEYDVVNGKKGKLYFNGQYVSCNLVSSKKQDWCMSVPFHIKKISVVTDYAFWVKEVEYYFKKQSQSELESADLDYSFDYTHDYKMIKGTEYLQNSHYTASDFIMRIFGPCKNPSIYIANHLYNVNVDIQDEEYLEIDSRDDRRNYSIILHGKYGEETNCFGKRNKFQSPFEKIPAGDNTLTWQATFDIGLILLQERSEPKWI